MQQFRKAAAVDTRQVHEAEQMIAETSMACWEPLTENRPLPACGLQRLQVPNTLLKSDRGIEHRRKGLGFHTPHPLADGARMLQISWATSASYVTEQLVERPGAVIDGYGRPLADVLLEFYDCLLSMPRNFRLVTYHMESAASLVSHEMLRCGLHFARQIFESIVRAQGHCLMDPSIHGGIQSSPPSYPTLEELAVVVLPDEERALPGFLSCGDECLLYLRLARSLRESTLPECRRTGHLPVRSMRLAMRDNGCHHSSSSLLPKGLSQVNEPCVCGSFLEHCQVLRLRMPAVWCIPLMRRGWIVAYVRLKKLLRALHASVSPFRVLSKASDMFVCV